MSNGKIKLKQTESITLDNIVLNGGITNNTIKFINSDSGIILTSPDETRWRMTINTEGQLITTTLDNPINYCPVVWLDARTVTYDGSNNITKWDDTSGNGYDATQAGTGSTTYGLTAFNGTQSVVFSGDNSQYMTIEVGLTISECTYFLVFEVESAPVVGSTLICDADELSSPGLDNKRLYWNGTSLINFRNGGPTPTPNVSSGGNNILAIRWENGPTASYRVNNGSWVSTTVNGGSDTRKFNLGNWHDVDFSGGRPLGVNLSQVVIYDYLLSDYSGDAVFEYFNNLYSVY